MEKGKGNKSSRRRPSPESPDKRKKPARGVRTRRPAQLEDREDGETTEVTAKQEERFKIKEENVGFSLMVLRRT